MWRILLFAVYTRVYYIYIHIKVLAPWALFCALGSHYLSGNLLFPRARRCPPLLQFNLPLESPRAFLFAILSCPSTSNLGGAAVLH